MGGQSAFDPSPCLSFFMTSLRVSSFRRHVCRTFTGQQVVFLFSQLMHEAEMSRELSSRVTFTAMVHPLTWVKPCSYMAFLRALRTRSFVLFLSSSASLEEEDEDKSSSPRTEADATDPSRLLRRFGGFCDAKNLFLPQVPSSSQARGKNVPGEEQKLAFETDTLALEEAGDHAPSSEEQLARKNRLLRFEEQVFEEPERVEGIVVHVLALLETATSFVKAATFGGNNSAEARKREALSRLAKLRQYFVTALVVFHLEFILQSRRIENWGFNDYSGSEVWGRFLAEDSAGARRGLRGARFVRDPNQNYKDKGWVFRRNEMLGSADQRLNFLVRIMGGLDAFSLRDHRNVASTEVVNNPAPLAGLLERSAFCQKNGPTPATVSVLNGEVQSLLRHLMAPVERAGTGFLHNNDVGAMVTNTFFAEQLHREQASRSGGAPQRRLTNGRILAMPLAATSARAWQAYRHLFLPKGPFREDLRGKDLLAIIERPRGTAVEEDLVLPFFLDKIPHFTELALALRTHAGQHEALDKVLDLYLTLSPFPTHFQRTSLETLRLGRPLAESARWEDQEESVFVKHGGKPVRDADMRAFEKILKLKGSDFYFRNHYNRVRQEVKRMKNKALQSQLFTSSKTFLLKSISHLMVGSILEPFFEKSEFGGLPLWTLATTKFPDFVQGPLQRVSFGIDDFEDHSFGVSFFGLGGWELLRYTPSSVAAFVNLVRDLRVGFFFAVESTYRGNNMDGDAPLSFFNAKFREIFNTTLGSANFEVLGFFAVLEEIAWAFGRLALVWEAVRLWMHASNRESDDSLFLDMDLQMRGAVVAALEGLHSIRSLLDVFEHDLKQPRLVSACLSPAYMALSALQ